MAVCFQRIMPTDLYGYSMKDTFAKGQNMCSDTLRMCNFEISLVMRSGRALGQLMYEYEKKQK